MHLSWMIVSMKYKWWLNKARLPEYLLRLFLPPSKETLLSCFPPCTIMTSDKPTKMLYQDSHHHETEKSLKRQKELFNVSSSVFLCQPNEQMLTNVKQVDRASYYYYYLSLCNLDKKLTLVCFPIQDHRSCQHVLYDFIKSLSLLIDFQIVFFA